MKNNIITKAFLKIRRRDFLPSTLKELADLDTALSIGYGQTISQPSVVLFMLKMLNPKKGDEVLDIGAGSGWTTALLAEIVGKRGRVIALDIVPELKNFGERNVDRYGFVKEGRVKFVAGNGSLGYPEESPFDRILCSASVQEKAIPLTWRKQLKVGGRIVTPIGSSIWVFTKKSQNKFAEKEYPGFVFVPLLNQK